MEIHRLVVTNRFRTHIQTPIGAQLSEMKLGHEGQFTASDSAPATRNRSHLIRQLSTAGLIAFCACALSLGINPASATYQVPSQESGSDKDDKDKEKDKDKEDRKSPFSKDVRNIKEYDLPDTQLKEYFRGTRAHRKEDPGLLKEVVLEPAKPTTEEMRKFDDLRKQQDIKKDEDLALIDKVVKWQVYSLTQPRKNWYSQSSERRKNRDAMETMLDTGGGGTEKFLAAYKQALMKYLPDLLDNHIWVRVNAMILMAKTRDERAIKMFCDQIQDPDQHESVKFVAMEGIEGLGQKKLITLVNLESLAIQTLLDVLAKPEQVHPFTRQQAVRALGSIGRPNRVVGGNDVDVSVALLKILRDPNIRRADRAETAVLLANLQVPTQADYNYQYVAYEIGQFAADVGAAALNDPTTDDLHSHFYLVDASYALVSEKRPDKSALLDRAKKNTAANTKGDVTYVRSLGDQVTKLTVEAIKIYKPDVVSAPAKAQPGKAAAKAPEDLVKKARDIKEGLQGRFSTQLDVLNSFLKSTPPRSMKLTPFIDELGPPPALAKEKVVSDDTAEAGNGDKEQVGANGTAGGRADP